MPVLRIVGFMLMACCGTACFAAAPQNGIEQRIVSAGGSVTEIIVALGKADALVATDTSSNFPAAIATLPKLGYFRQLNTEGVLAQQPSLFIGAAATGPHEMLQQLSNAGVTVKIVDGPRSLDGLMKMIDSVAMTLDVKGIANQLKANIQAKVDQQLLSAQSIATQKLKAIYLVSNSDRGLTVAGKNTVPDALFNLLGIENIGALVNEYGVLDNETITGLNPDFVLVAGHSKTSKNALQQFCQHAALLNTTAGKHCQISFIDSSISLGLSVRIDQAIAQIARVASQASKTHELVKYRP